MYVVIAWPRKSSTNLYSEKDEVDQELKKLSDWIKAGAQMVLSIFEHKKWLSDFMFLESPSYFGEPPLTRELEQAFKFRSLSKAEAAQKQIEYYSLVLSDAQAEKYIAERG